VLAGTTTVNDTRHDGFRVDPVLRVRELEGEQQALAGEHGIGGRDEHPRNGKIDDPIGDQPKVVFADELTRRAENMAR
jgi:hypothetical protein